MQICCFDPLAPTSHPGGLEVDTDLHRGRMIPISAMMVIFGLLGPWVVDVGLPAPKSGIVPPRWRHLLVLAFGAHLQASDHLRVARADHD
eukprot:9087223-Pyramimonas_sp.AAC.1